MYPVLAKRSSKAHYKPVVGSTIRIGFDAKGIGAGQRERVSSEFLWVRGAASETIFSECTIVDFECGVAMRQVLVSEIDLTELWRALWIHRKWTPIEIGFPQSQSDGYWWLPWTTTAWQPGLEECARVNMGMKEHPNLDAAIRDRECAESILDRVQLFFGDVLFDEFVGVH